MLIDKSANEIKKTFLCFLVFLHFLKMMVCIINIMGGSYSDGWMSYFHI